MQLKCQLLILILPNEVTSPIEIEVYPTLVLLKFMNLLD